MIGLTSLEVYNSLLNLTEKIKKFGFCTEVFDEFSFAELKDKLEQILSIPDNTQSQKDHEIRGQRIIHAFKKLRSETSSTGGNFILLMGYARSPFREIQSYLRIVDGLDENDI